MFELIIIGAGPAGIAAAYEAKKHDLKYLVIEKGLIGNTIYNYPVGLTVFSGDFPCSISVVSTNVLNDDPVCRLFWVARLYR